MSRAKGSGTATLADLLAIPEDQRRHEIINGELVEKKAASGEHGRAQGRVISQLGGAFDRKPGGPKGPGGWWFATEVEVALAPNQIYRPDIVGWRRDRVPLAPEDAVVVVRPDWVCEILSTNRGDDLVRKYAGYFAAGVPHYWILDPRDETLMIYRWSQVAYLGVLMAARGQVVRPEPFDALEFDLGVFFGDDEA